MPVLYKLYKQIVTRLLEASSPLSGDFIAQIKVSADFKPFTNVGNEIF